MHTPSPDTPPTFRLTHHTLGLAYALSLLIALLMAVGSLLSLLNPGAAYPTQTLHRSFFANDIVNLVIGLPTLLGALLLARRNSLVGLLLWPGALMFVLYNYLAYVFALPASWIYLLHLTLVALSVYLLIGLVTCIDAEAVGARLKGAVPEKGPAAVLILMGAFVFLRVFAVIAAAVSDPSSVSSADLAILPPDFLLSPAWVLGGVLLWGRRNLGYVSGLGLLFQASMLFIGLIAVLLLQPVLTGAPLDLSAILTVAGMGLICFIPFGLFLSGAARKP